VNTLSSFLRIVCLVALASLTTVSRSQPVSSVFQRPVDVSAQVSNQVGVYEPTYFCGNHLGIDLAVPILTTVRAIADGVVRYSRYRAGLGDGVHIEHSLPDGSRVISVYYHIKAPAAGRIREGTSVTRGQLIGVTTDIRTDYGTGPHLHFAIRVGPYQTGTDSRTERWFYPGYSSIFVNDVRLCNQADSRHADITSEWEPEPLAFIDARLAPPSNRIYQGNVVVSGFTSLPTTVCQWSETWPMSATITVNPDNQGTLRFVGTRTTVPNFPQSCTGETNTPVDFSIPVTVSGSQISGSVTFVGFVHTVTGTITDSQTVAMTSFISRPPYSGTLTGSFTATRQ